MLLYFPLADDAEVSEHTEQCDLLETFSENLCFFNESQVNGLLDETIGMCPEPFQSCDFSHEIMTLLATKAANVSFLFTYFIPLF